MWRATFSTYITPAYCVRQCVMLPAVYTPGPPQHTLSPATLPSSYTITYSHVTRLIVNNIVLLSVSVSLLLYVWFGLSISGHIPYMVYPTAPYIWTHEFYIYLCRFWLFDCLCECYQEGEMPGGDGCRLRLACVHEHSYCPQVQVLWTYLIYCMNSWFWSCSFPSGCQYNNIIAPVSIYQYDSIVMNLWSFSNLAESLKNKHGHSVILFDCHQFSMSMCETINLSLFKVHQLVQLLVQHRHSWYYMQQLRKLVVNYTTCPEHTGARHTGDSQPARFCWKTSHFEPENPSSHDKSVNPWVIIVC